MEQDRTTGVTAQCVDCLSLFEARDHRVRRCPGCRRAYWSGGRSRRSIPALRTRQLSGEAWSEGPWVKSLVSTDWAEGRDD